MKKLFIILAGIAVYISYDFSNSEVTIGSDDTKNDIHTETFNITDFLSQFEKIKFDTLHVYSPVDKINNGNKFIGKEIESKYYLNFDEHFLSMDVKVYACFKFDISDEIIGLILRGPGKYLTPTDLYLWTYLKSENRFEKNWPHIYYMLQHKSSYLGTETAMDKHENWNFRTYGMRIASNWRGEGICNIEDSWLFDYDNDGRLDIITKYKHDICNRLDDSYDQYRQTKFITILNLEKGFLESKNIQFDNEEFKTFYFSKSD